jgi:hypothetical protein
LKFFGTRYAAPAYAEAEQVEPPVGACCARCDEPIASEDEGWLIPAIGTAGARSELPFHRACYLRGMVGSVAHQQRRCSCFVTGGTAEDDPALSVRAAAQAAEAYFEAHIEANARPKPPLH